MTAATMHEGLPFHQGTGPVQCRQRGEKDPGVHVMPALLLHTLHGRHV